MSLAYDAVIGSNRNREFLSAYKYLWKVKRMPVSFSLHRLNFHLLI